MKTNEKRGTRPRRTGPQGFREIVCCTLDYLCSLVPHFEDNYNELENNETIEIKLRKDNVKYNKFK